MGIRSDYKKNTTKECHYCDYLTCRKGHKCKWYKKFVKMFARRKAVWNELQGRTKKIPHKAKGGV